MKTDLSFVSNIIDGHIWACKEQQNMLNAEDEQQDAYFNGAIEALEHVRETIKKFIKSANQLEGDK